MQRHTRTPGFAVALGLDSGDGGAVVMGHRILSRSNAPPPTACWSLRDVVRPRRLSAACRFSLPKLVATCFVPLLTKLTAPRRSVDDRCVTFSPRTVPSERVAGGRRRFGISSGGGSWRDVDYRSGYRRAT